MRFRWVEAAAVVTALGVPAHAAPLELARAGQSGYVVVVPPAPTPAEKLAAEELSAYIGRISGARLPVRETPDPPREAIVLARRAIPGGPALSGETYRIGRRGSRIYLAAGRDRATLFAAYDFLQRLGCRWLAPQFGFYQGYAELVPSKRDLNIELDQDVIEKPVLAFRKLYVEEGHSHSAENLAQLTAWMPKLRFNTLVVPTNYQGRGVVRWDNWREKLTPELQRRDLIIEVGGHGYQNFLNAGMEEEGRKDGKLFDLHPDWFGQDRQGVRRREPGWVLCTSNADARGYLLRNFLAYVRDRPEIQIFDFWPPDGARWCECPKCAALGSPSDRQALLLNEVRGAAEKVRPDLRLEVLAYHTSITPPERVKLDSRILVDFCPISQCFEKPINDPSDPRNAMYASGLKAWRKAFDGDISIYSYYRKYAWKSLPVIIPGYMQRDLEWYLTQPVQGISSYAEPGDWGAYELNHYTLGRLAWNPAAEVDAVIREFCEARYGPAGRTAAGALVRLGDVVRTHGSIPSTALKESAAVRRARAELDAEAATLTEAAGSLTDPAHAAAVKRLLLSYDYARRDLEIQDDRAAMRPQARKKVEDLAAFLVAHAGDGVFLIHGRTQAARLLQSYGLEPRRAQ